jgi:hypothetical protein
MTEAALYDRVIKWPFQPQRRGGSWQRTIREQRNSIARRLRRTLDERCFASLLGLTGQSWSKLWRRRHCMSSL